MHFSTVTAIIRFLVFPAKHYWTHVFLTLY
jgi:hypothetical protein